MDRHGIDGSVAILFLTLLGPHEFEPARLLRLWDFPSKNTVAGIHYILQGIFQTLGSKPESPAIEGKFFTTEISRKCTEFVTVFSIFRIFSFLLIVSYGQLSILS